MSVVALRPSRLISRLPHSQVRGVIRQAMRTEPSIAAIALQSRIMAPSATPRARELDHGDADALVDLYFPFMESTTLIWNPSRANHESDELIRRVFIPDLEPWVDV